MSFFCLFLLNNLFLAFLTFEMALDFKFEISHLTTNCIKDCEKFFLFNILLKLIFITKTLTFTNSEKQDQKLPSIYNSNFM